jgi:hypothetical protein
MTKQNSMLRKVKVMLEISPSVNQTLCRVHQVDYCLPSQPCGLCESPAERFTTATRTAIDLDLDAPVLLQVTISVHHCPDCHHYFRAQPPFLRPRAIYTNRVVDKAVQSVYNDDMAMRRVTERRCQEPDVNVPSMLTKTSPPMFTRNAPGMFTNYVPLMFTENDRRC